MRRRTIGPLILGIVLSLTMAEGSAQSQQLMPLDSVPAAYADKHMPAGWWTDPKVIKEGKEIYFGDVSFCNQQAAVRKILSEPTRHCLCNDRRGDNGKLWKHTAGIDCQPRKREKQEQIYPLNPAFCAPKANQR